MNSAWKKDKLRKGACPCYQYWFRKSQSSKGGVKSFAS